MNNYVLILGASSGIGAACAEEFSKKGFNIIGVYLRKPKSHIEELTKRIKKNKVKVTFIKSNAANPNYRKKIINDIKKDKTINIKAFVHSLAFGTLKPFIHKEQNKQLNQKNIEMTLDVMACSLIYWVQDLFHANLLNQGCQVVSMTSQGSSKQWESYGAISMAKSSLESATRQLALELAPYKIACNCIQAGVTHTAALEKIPNYQAMIENTKQQNPHKKLSTTIDIAHAAVSLGSSKNYWITGNTIKADGGESLTN
tara:strand:- start:406 stop:1176 length:771 start_codon:yes stop_codon:yes gene_type:complete